MFIAFAVFSVPGGVLAARIGKKKLLLLGLGINALAVLIPTLYPPTYAVLLGCIFLLGVGTTFLQVAGNPIMRDVSAQGAYCRNLSFAQGFKGIGSTASTYLVSVVAGIAIFASMGWRGAFPVFFVLMALAFVLVSLIKVEETKADEPSSIGSSLGLLGKPAFLLAVVGIFLYVGAEASMGRFLLPMLKSMGVKEATASTFGPAMFFLLLTIGRLVGGVILTVLRPRTFFRTLGLAGRSGRRGLDDGRQGAGHCRRVRRGPGLREYLAAAVLDHGGRKARVRQRTLGLDVHGHFRRRHRALNHGTAGRFEIGNICLRRAGRLFRLSAGSVA